MARGYARRTSKKGKEDSISIPSQVERLKQCGYTDEPYIDDGKTASLSEENIDFEVTDKYFIVKYDINVRPDFKRMLLDAKDKKIPDNKLGIWKWDRFSRHPAFLISAIEFLKKNGVEVKATDDSNESIVIMLQGVLGMTETKKMSERVNLAKLNKFNQGIYCGVQRKIGYEWKRVKIEGKNYNTLMPKNSSDKEVQMVKDIRDKDLGYKEACLKYGINPQTYYNIKNDEFYDGFLIYKGEKKKGIHGLII